MRRFVVSAFLFALLAVCLSSLAEAKVVAHISLSAQRMNVSVNGVPRYSWPVSTARAGYRTPTGTLGRPDCFATTHRPFTAARRCPIQYSSWADTPYTGPMKLDISAVEPRMAACGCIPPMQPRFTL